VLLGLVTVSLLAASPGPSAAPLRLHRTATEITDILARGPHAGDCERCHVAHSAETIPQPNALIGPDDNALCDGCHTQAWSGGSYPNPLVYSASAHGSSPSMIWPGPDPPPRTELGAAAKCVNCHDPHGAKDQGGDIPALSIAREEALCLACHDGNPALTNVHMELSKPFRHPVTDVSGRHTGASEALSSDFAAAPINRRHAECEDCHNPHVAHGDRSGPPLAPALSNRNLGVSRVRPQNGAAGVPPAFEFLAGSDTLTAPLAEYQLCFKCHSSWTAQPSGQTDLALELNPANPSYHPVEEAGRDPFLAPQSFVPGWSASSLTRCGDCHGSDDGQVAGPHGSAYRFILRRPYTASPQTSMMAPDEICFSCHAYDVYANPMAPASTAAASRFSKPGAVEGHAEHVGTRGVPCYGCHVTHGSATEKHLLVTGRVPGITAYTETPTGGTCAATCHDAKDYTVSYAR
jgi:predicted CXXCH cytochrome family protein